MTGTLRTPQPAAKHPGPLRRAQPLIVLYIALATIPVLMWRAAGNPITATLPYLNINQAELFWNTLREDPAADASELALAAIDVAWIVWTPFALAAVLQLLVTVFHIPRTVIPRMLLRLTPTTVVSIVVTGTATVAQASAGAAHATALQHHHLGHERGRDESSARRQSPLEAQVIKAITDPEHHRHHWGADAHTVQQGETLWIIAEDAYGRGQDWPEIYDANRGRIEQSGEVLANPDLIKPGWTLTVPHHGPAPTPPRVTGADPAPPNTTGTGAPVVGGATSATVPRVAPATPAPVTTASSAAERPVPPTAATAPNGANNPPHAVPGPRTNAPWTTGVELPDGGYIGVSLLIAAAGAALALRRRARRTGQSPDVPDSVRELTVIASRAEMAANGDWDPELETDPTPPPLLRPRPEHLIFGTARTGTDEAILDPEHHPLTVYTGPGAHQAAAALALSALASEPPHRLVTTETLAHQLFGAGTEPADPAWLTLVPDTPAALNVAASQLEDANVRTLLIADAQGAGIFQVSAALAADQQCNGLAILLIGDPSHLAAHPLTNVTVDEEGRPTKVTGPRAAAFAGARFHTLPRPMAADLFTTLRHDRAARTAHRIPAQARGGRHVQPADQHPEPDSADDEHHQDAGGPTAIDEPELRARERLPHAAATSASSPRGSLIDSATTPPRAPVLLRLLGPLVVENVAGQTRPGPGGRNAQLLTYLGIHPRGRTLQQITAAIWNTDKPGGLNRALVRLRQDLRAAVTELAPEHIPNGEDVQLIVREPHGTYHLNHKLIRTDYADFTSLEAEASTENNLARRTELAAQALAHVRGDLAEGVSDLDQTWLLDERADLDDRAAALAHTSASADLGGQGADAAGRTTSVFARTTTP